MLRKYLGALAAVMLVVAFFASRPPETLAQPAKDYKSLVALLDDKALNRMQLRRFVQAGTPALDAVLSDFSRSTFVRNARQNLRRGYNLGRAMDRSVYASNVVKVAEAFGMVGVDRLVRRVDPAVVKGFGLNTPAFRKLGAGTIKPLLAMEVVRGRGPGHAPVGKLKDWAKDLVIEEEVEEIQPGGDVMIWAAVAEAVAVAVVTYAAEKAAEWAYEKYVKKSKQFEILVSNPAVNLNRKEMLSPAARTRMMLRELDPDFLRKVAAATP